jgi:hypothetical protein
MPPTQAGPAVVALDPAASTDVIVDAAKASATSTMIPRTMLLLR